MPPYFSPGSIVQGQYMGNKSEDFKFVGVIEEDLINQHEGIIRYGVKLITSVSRPGSGQYNAGESINVYLSGKSATTLELVSKPD